MSSFYCLPNMATTLNKAASDEGRRFLLLTERDGMDAAVQWVKRTIKLYEESERQLQALVEHLDRDPAPLVFWLVE